MDDAGLVPGEYHIADYDIGNEEDKDGCAHASADPGFIPSLRE